MKAWRNLIALIAVGALAPSVRGGHELPVYPSYYPHEIEVAALDARRAGAQLAAGELHAYIGAAAQFAATLPAAVSTMPSLGAFLVVRLNPESAAAGDESAACGIIGSVVRELTARGGDVVAHPYPITPLHGDYLHHADQADAARARFTSGGPTTPDLKVRARSALTQSLLRPEWRAEAVAWTVSLEEADAADLVVSATTHLNGWLGPRWIRSGWFHAYRLLADAVADPDHRRELAADVARLQTGAFASPAERANLERSLVRRLTEGCRAAVVGYTLKREYFNASFSNGIENLSTDALEGFSSPMFLRTVKLKDFPWNGWLKLGVASPPQAAWNPVAGFTDAFGRLMWFAVGDPAAVPSPYDHTWVLNRISEVEAVPRR